ncbi:26S protease regulatory subunit [Streptosporangiaceae bacterium NEAU-GS5]|nr:26S protease regulatory subunit [Streptosporangiaceae bacterium NEAU-GS5]
MDDSLRLTDSAALARALAQILEQGHVQLQASRPTPELVLRITAHVGCSPRELVSVSENYPPWDAASLQRGVDAYLALHTPDAQWFGITGHQREHEELANILAMADRAYRDFELGAADWTTAAISSDASMEVVGHGMILTRTPDGAPILVGVRGPADRFGRQHVQLDILAADRAAGSRARAEIDALKRELDVLRGQILSFGASEHMGNQLVSFLPRPRMESGQVVLPDGVLDTIERHVVDVGTYASRLRAHGQHLKRGLLLHGPPGTGKTHTVRYLMSRTEGSTVIIMTGAALRFVEQAAALARRLQPAIVVVEDVDLVAMDRSMSADGGGPLLFTLLDAMDGIGADADVTFVLTTNRADALERALADRPGRVDLAVEIPRPDAAGRAALLRLYAGDLRLDGDLGEVVERSAGATASFFKELLRRSVLLALRERETVTALTAAHLSEALEEMTSEREALTRSLLGSAVGVTAPGRVPRIPG